MNQSLKNPATGKEMTRDEIFGLQLNNLTREVTRIKIITGALLRLEVKDEDTLIKKMLLSEIVLFCDQAAASGNPMKLHDLANSLGLKDIIGTVGPPPPGGGK